MESLSLGAPASPTVEEAARWVQWALVADTEEKARYNLTQFWNLKQPIYYAVSNAERLQLDKLDVLANGELARLEQQKAGQDVPWVQSTGAALLLGPVVAYDTIAGKKAVAKDKAAAAAAWEASKAAAGRVKAEAITSQDVAYGGAMETFAGRAGIQANQQIDELSHDTSVEGIVGNVGKKLAEPFLGIPLWGWIAGGAVILVGVVVISKGSR